MPQQGFADGFENSNSGGVGSAAPVGEELLGGGLRGLFPELTEFVLEVVGLRQRFVEP